MFARWAFTELRSVARVALAHVPVADGVALLNLEKPQQCGLENGRPLPTITARDPFADINSFQPRSR